jgi:hypothetical protein
VGEFENTGVKLIASCGRTKRKRVTDAAHHNHIIKNRE